jgi:type IX secretion system PorP/SprF family membrane protein
MYRYILSIIMMLLPWQLFSQLFPLSDQYTFNALVINPAYAGCQDALSATLQYRDQWVGFQDAPKSRTLSVHAPLKNDRIGLGLMVSRNTIGIYKETTFLGNYAFRHELYNGKLALGLGFGVTAYHVAWNELDATDADDEQLMNNSTTAVLPDFSLGAYYYTKKYFIGISLPMFLSHISDESTGDFKVKNNFSDYNYFISGGYEISAGPVTKFLPSVLIKYHPNYSLQVDYNVQLIVKNIMKIGVGYRNKDILIGMLQCKINEQLNLAYSYDFCFGRLGGYKNSSHEIALSYVFRYARKVMGPRQI